MLDNWCVGYSERFAVGVWAGNFDGSPMQDVSGIIGAAPVWLEVMNYLHHGIRARAPQPPAGVVSADVRFVPELEAARREYFIRATEITEVKLPNRSESHISRIAYPGRGAILAVDPDIPPGHQRVFFEIVRAEGNYKVSVNNTMLASLDAGWLPTPGRHQVTLFDHAGAVLDRTEFEVRGASLP